MTQDHASLNRRQFLFGSMALGATVALGGLSTSLHAAEAKAKHTLPALPYADTALDPVISSRTMGFHYGKHHAGYLNNLNKLIVGTPYADATLEATVMGSAGKADQVAIFNNAAQVWNHTFYWNSMKPKGGGELPKELKMAVEESFGSVEEMKKQFAQMAVSQFASGWGWLVADKEGKLKAVKTSNAGNPITEGMKPLLVIDVWEHAYYLDYQNLRAKYVNAVIDQLMNWEFALKNLKA